MPTTGGSKISRNVGGESIDEIILHYVNFKRRKKVYTYAVPRKDPDYVENNPLSEFSFGNREGKTKEDNK